MGSKKKKTTTILGKTVSLEELEKFEKEMKLVPIGKIHDSNRASVLRFVAVPNYVAALIEELLENYVNLSKTFDARQKEISDQLKIPQTLEQLSRQMERLTKSQAEIQAEASRSEKTNLIIGITGTIIGIVGIALALLTFI